MTFIVALVIKTSLVLALAHLVVWLLKRSCAAVRHLALAVAFAGVLMLPVAMLALPDVAIRWPAPLVATPVATFAPTASAEPPAAPASTQRSADRLPTRTAWPISISNVLMLGWAIGVFAVLVPIAAGRAALRNIRRRGSRFVEAEELMNELGAELGVSRPLELMIHHELTGPMTCGVVNPAIVFPPDVREWPTDDVRRALRHELEHVRRADCLIDGIAGLTCALYWFHPLAWQAWRRLRLEAECACDDAVLRSADAITYAEQLVTLAARMSTSRAPAVLAMAGRRDLVRRVAAVLDREQRRGEAGRRSTIASLAIGLTLVATVAATALQRTPAVGPLSFEVASVKENASGDPFGGGDRLNMRLYPGGRFSARNASLQDLILLAYRDEITRSQLPDLPSWMTERRFDIEARGAEGVVAAGEIDHARAQLIDRMLQGLLADRFKLRVRREEKVGDLLVLSVAPGGPKLGPPKDEAVCNGLKDRRGLALVSEPAVPCHVFTRIGRTGLDGRAVDTTDIVMALRLYLGRPVVDRTRLRSLHDVTVHWNPDVLNRTDRAGTFNNEPQPDENDPDMYTALREQLGLKLEAQRAPIAMLIVESAEPPASN